MIVAIFHPRGLPAYLAQPAPDRDRPMRLLSWNINGLRAWIQREEKELCNLLDSLNADIICFQESKLTRSELDLTLAQPAGKAV